MNQFVTHMHAFSTKTQRTSGQKGPLRSCPVVLHRICPYNWTFKYDANVICTSLSVACALIGKEDGAAAIAARGAACHTRWRAPPKAMLDPGLSRSRSSCRDLFLADIFKSICSNPRA